MDDTAENRLKETLFVVEATSFEEQALWCTHAAINSSERKIYGKAVSWKQMHGWLVTVGEFHKHPVCVSMHWNLIDGYPVMFYYATSRIVDHTMIDEWIDAHFSGTWDNGHRRAKTDAMNFHHCIHAIREKISNRNLQK